MKNLDHPGIVRYLGQCNIEQSMKYDGLDLPAGTFIVMEYVQSTLETLIGCYIDYDQLIELFQQLLESVKYMHSQQVVHRDLKPDNILISNDG